MLKGVNFNMEKIFIIDIGIIVCKVIVFDLEGNILVKVNREYFIYIFQIEWVEQDFFDWWNEVVEGIKEVVQVVGVDGIVVIGFLL